MTKELTPQQASLLTGYHEGHLTKACQRGDIKARKVGRRWLMETNSVLEFGKRKPHKRTSKDMEEIMDQLDLVDPEPETEEDLLEEDLPTEEPEQICDHDLRHAAVFTYEDLLEQYRRGLREGFIEGVKARAEA